MCQLLGMNCNTPTDIVFSFEGFSKRGGLTDHHTDGFGIGFFEGRGLRLFLDNRPSAHSPVAELIRQYQIKSENVIAHIRKATQGQVLLENTHPFRRELWGRYWLFAHNGHLNGFVPPQGEYFTPVGNTDSERAFCYILEQLRQRFTEQPERDVLFAAVRDLVGEIRAHGLFNMMLSNGEMLFAHTSTLLFYIVRQAPFGKANLSDAEVSIDFTEVTTPKDRVAVIATLPLTDNETWTQLAQNELVLFQQGEIVCRDRPDLPVYLSKEEGLRIARSVGAAL
ncbi:class II glutamine amidotransferase [Conchiformibius steedae DSM 2580]|uniref:Class II glutamine amidotransferase n=1 Tax=Conchiformibius steedae DSM 2580 TaxID=1121352 RepID=A0AAE9HWE3_9NEIS|nr:class II glutamine amidotransferase [Conchiformibius steedae]QMT32984.1 class II glutamine amidotransferase [Conchiformibius steedae]URD67607.1 class II glutamine amidotransferase [Conchiformibius steedae DSM 2580]